MPSGPDKLDADASQPDAVRAGAIYVVATPIGNLEDLTLRAIRVLREVDLVAAEDTRRTRHLLDHLGIAQRVVAYYDAVEAARCPELVRRALAGESIALVSDAGTPLVSDPGFRLVRAAIDAGVEVIAVPGPSAPLALLACAGLPPARFTFVGFLPSRQGARRRALGELADRPDTLLFFEAPRRLPEALADMAEIFGERDAVVGRELTKRFEEVARGRLAELATRFAARAEAGSLRGEIVVAVGGRPERRRVVAAGRDDPREAGGDPRDAATGVAWPGAETSDSDGDARLLLPSLDERLQARLAGGETVAAAARVVAGELGLPRRDVYRRAVELRALAGRPSR